MASILITISGGTDFDGSTDFTGGVRAADMAAIISRSQRVIPLATSAENPPRKINPHTAAASSSAGRFAKIRQHQTLHQHAKLG